MKIFKGSILIVLLAAGLSFAKSGTYSGGDGDASGDSEANAIYISTPNDLIELSQWPGDWSLYFKQTADIVFNEDETLVDWNADGNPDGADPEGFISIGNGYNIFTGTYDGGGYTISNIYINRPTGDNIGGLLGYTNGSALKNVGIINSSITARQNVGGLVGRNADNSTILNCFAEATVNGETNVGGLVGYNYNSVINESFSTGSVSGVLRTGGFIGYNQNRGMIYNCYSTGSVTRSSGTYSQTGGFIGQSYYSNIYRCYSTGAVYYSGETDPVDKGFVGFTDLDTYKNNFYDINTSNQTSAEGATGKTTSEMKTVATFTDFTDGSDGLVTPVWDFETNPNDDAANNNYWDIDLSGSINNGYPFLSWQNGETTALPVELISFNAIKADKGVKLNWQTATEVNNYGFEVERTRLRSSNSAEVSWETLSFVPGHGNSNRPKSYELVDDSPPAGELIYRLKQIDTDGSYEYYSTTVQVNNSLTGIEEEQIPTEYYLSQNYPNPFNPSTTIKYSIPELTNVRIDIYNNLGEIVTTLINRLQGPGNYKVQFDGSSLSSGVYYYKLEAGGFVQTRKLMLLK